SDAAVDRVVRVGEDACAHAGQQRGAVGGALLRLRALDRQVEHGGNDARPEVAAEAAAGETTHGRLDPEPAQELERVAQAGGNAAKTTPEVPRTSDATPGATAPAARPAAAWSPAPAIAVDSCAGGNHSCGSSSASQTSSDQRRCATSKSSVPDASAASIARSPVRRRRT